MGYESWKDKVEIFEKIDLRGAKMNFFLKLRKRAQDTPVGKGLHIVQTFEPLPLYKVLERMGFEHHTERVSDEEYHVYFYRVEER